MKKGLVALLSSVVCLSMTGMTSVLAEEIIIHTTTPQSKTEKIFDTVTTKTKETAQKTADIVKKDSKKAGEYIIDKSSDIAEDTGDAVKSGAKKAGEATVRGARKAKRATARGIRNTAEKIQKAAQKSIDESNKQLGDAPVPQKVQTVEVIEVIDVVEPKTK